MESDVYVFAFKYLSLYTGSVEKAMGDILSRFAKFVVKKVTLEADPVLYLHTITGFKREASNSPFMTCCRSSAEFVTSRNNAMVIVASGYKAWLTTVAAILRQEAQGPFRD